MTKKNLWMRLLALVLACGLMLGCFVGCDSSSESSGGGSSSGGSSAKKLRKGLEEYEVDGLLIYLDEEMEKHDYSYANEDNSMSVNVNRGEPDYIEEFGEDYDIEIDSAKTLLDAYLASAEDEEVEILDSGKKNGAYYLTYEMEWDTVVHYVLGLYYQDGYAWVVSVRYEDEDDKDTAIKYATICQFEPYFDPEDLEDDYADYEENVDGY